MKRFFVCVLITSAICACDKSNNNGTSAPAPTKVENENPASIPGAWMEEKYRAAYDLANSQNPDSACALLVQVNGTQSNMTTPENYLVIGQGGDIQNCATEGGVGGDGRATPITFQCKVENSAKIDPATGNIQGPTPDCTGKISANETKAIVTMTCGGKTETSTSARIQPRGFENFITVARDCMLKANDKRRY